MRKTLLFVVEGPAALRRGMAVPPCYCYRVGNRTCSGANFDNPKKYDVVFDPVAMDVDVM